MFKRNAKMKFSPIRKFLVTSVALAALGACTPTPEPTDPADPVDPPVEPSSINVTTGATSGEGGTGSNGLRFADGAGVEFDGEIVPAGSGPIVHTLRGVVLSRTELEEGTDVAAKMADMEFTIYPDADDPSNFIITADVDGETALINFDETGFYCDEGAVTSSAGNQYCFAIQPISDELALVYAFTDDFFGERGPRRIGPDIFGSNSDVVLAAWIGLETNPDLLAFKGLTEYYGMFGLAIGVDNEDILITDGGEIGMRADFSAGTIEGYMYGDDGGAEFEGEIAGNGFSANITAVEFEDSDLETVGDIGQLDGVFYGVTGSTAAGTILVDTQVTDGENTYDAAGAGLFVMEENGGDL